MLNSFHKECILPFEYWSSCCCKSLPYSFQNKQSNIPSNELQIMCGVWKAASVTVIKKSSKWSSRVCSAARQPARCWHQLYSFTLMEMFHSAKHHYCFYYISSPYTYCLEWLIQENWTVAWARFFFHLLPPYLVIHCNTYAKECRVKIAAYLQDSILIWVDILFWVLILLRRKLFWISFQKADVQHMGSCLGDCNKPFQFLQVEGKSLFCRVAW